MKNKNQSALFLALGGCLIAVIVLFVVMMNQMKPVELSTDETSTSTNEDIKHEDAEMKTIAITIGDEKFTLQLANTAAAEEIAAATPFELLMKDLNHNEKYYYGESLPTAEYDVKTIHAGDVMLYGDNCIVLFYKDFETSYRYTKIGKITDPTKLAGAVGDGDINVIFTKQ